MAIKIEGKNKRTVEEMAESFSQRISFLKEQLDKAVKTNDPTSRAMFASSIAVLLRMLVCPDIDNGNSLIKLSRIKTNILFPFQHNLEAYNELRTFALVGMKITGNRCEFHFDGQVVPDGVVCESYLSYYNWIHEIVIDFKQKEYPPLSRNDIIHIVADKFGAHYQKTIDDNVYLIENYNVMDVMVLVNNVECEVNCANLFNETILCIASELVYSYDYLLNKRPKRNGLSDLNLCLFDFEDGEKHRYKYSLVIDGVNQYNTNRFYDCKMSKSPLHVCSLKIIDRFFLVNIIDTSYMLNYK